MLMTAFTSSGNREQRTATNFENQIWSILKPNEKVIVLYHYAHLIPKFKTCMPFSSSLSPPYNFYSDWTDGDWLEAFRQKHPEIDQVKKLVIFDEKDSMFGPEGNFVFSKRQYSRHPNENWAVPLAPFFEIEKEKGIDMFLPNSTLKIIQGGQTVGTGLLPEVVDGIIWSSDASLNYTYNFKDPGSYLPMYCHAQ